MCGIAGCLALALEADPDQAWLTRALDRISHRGPDDDGVYTDSDVALGFRRLSIIDLSQAGHQPMRSADGRFWMVFNGEIYNYVEHGRRTAGAGGHAAVQRRLRGAARDLRPGGQGRGAPAPRHVRASPSGTPGPANCSAPGTRSASSPSTTASTAGPARSPAARPTALPAARLPRASRPARAAAGMRHRRQPASRPRRSRLTLREPWMTGSPPPRRRPGGQAGTRPEGLMGLA